MRSTSVVIDTSKGRKRLANTSNATNDDMDIDPPPPTPLSSTAVLDLEDGDPINLSDDSPKSRRHSINGKMPASPAAKAKLSDLEKCVNWLFFDSKVTRLLMYTVLGRRFSCLIPWASIIAGHGKPSLSTYCLRQKTRSTYPKGLANSPR